MAQPRSGGAVRTEDERNGVMTSPLEVGARRAVGDAPQLDL
jgi:hypothetical protein